VAFDRLIDALWTREPPATAANQVHRLVGQLRRLFEPDLPVRTSGLVRTAHAHFELGQYAEATEYAELGLASLERTADVDTEIDALGILAQAAFETGDHTRAGNAWDRFYALSDSFADSRARAAIPQR
jgi:hypothetical protein